MSNWLEKAIIFAVGAAVGSSAVYFGVKKSLEKRYEEKYEQDIASARESYRRHRKTMEFEKSEAEISKPIVSSTPEEKAEYDTISALYKGHEELKELTNYDRISENDNASKGTSAEDDYPEPYFISLDDFGMKEDYDSLLINHYDDDIFAYDDDMLVDTQELSKYFGSDFCKRLKEHTLDDRCYIRNERKKRDYEIARVYMTYENSIDWEPHSIGG